MSAESNWRIYQHPSGGNVAVDTRWKSVAFPVSPGYAAELATAEFDERRSVTVIAFLGDESFYVRTGDLAYLASSDEERRELEERRLEALRIAGVEAT